VLHAQIRILADDLCVRRAEGEQDKRELGPSSATPQKLDHAAPRRGASRATTRGFDARYIVTTLEGSAEHLYETVYCARAQAENFISCTRPSSPRTGPLAAAPAPISSGSFSIPPPTGCCTPCRRAPSARAGKRRVSRRCGFVDHSSRPASSRAPRAIRVWLPTACPDAAIFRCSPAALPPRGHEPRGAVAPRAHPANRQPRHNQHRHQRRKQRRPSARSHPQNRPRLSKSRYADEYVRLVITPPGSAKMFLLTGSMDEEMRRDAVARCLGFTIALVGVRVNLSLFRRADATRR